ncbi:MAG TPA: superoxide dismutase [Vitreimonas sp.]|jgi:Fe-Mn family superoxide dismutase|nr:superoxide dismutase [Vitreimonas sp.]
MTTFKLPPLPFDERALEPSMSAETLRFHHDKHHAAYIKKTNALIAEMKDAPATLEEVVRRADKEKNGKLFNQAAQAWNHAFFWQSLSAEPQAATEGGLRRAIERRYKDMGSFREEALTKGETHFASGWLWLVASEDGAVELKDMHDAQSPIVDPKQTPLFVCDLWEHAYYIDYRNERRRFLEAFFDKLVNWRFAEKQYECARAGGGDAWRFPA